jgi:hypothetical protein
MIGYLFLYIKDILLHYDWQSNTELKYKYKY